MLKISGCAVSIVASLTGIRPEVLLMTYPVLHKQVLDADEMIDVLTAHGIELFEIDDEVVNPSKKEWSSRITKRHVILELVRASKDENSWIIRWNHHFWHNFQKELSKDTSVINKPAIRRFLVKNPDWLSDRVVLTRAVKRFKKGEITKDQMVKICEVLGLNPEPILGMIIPQSIAW